MLWHCWFELWWQEGHLACKNLTPAVPNSSSLEDLLGPSLTWSNLWIIRSALSSNIQLWLLHYYAALLPRRGPHIASHSVCLSLRLSVRLSVRPVSGCTLFTVATSYERTSKIEKLRFSLMGQRHVCTFRHAQRAAYRTAISAAQILVFVVMYTFASQKYCWHAKLPCQGVIV